MDERKALPIVQTPLLRFVVDVRLCNKSNRWNLSRVEFELTWRRERQRSTVESDGLKLMMTTVKFQRQLNLIGPDAGVVVQSYDHLTAALPSINQSINQSIERSVCQ